MPNTVPLLFGHTYCGPTRGMIVAVTWLIQLMPLLVVGIPTWISGRGRVRWNLWDFAIMVLPFALFAVCYPGHRSISAFVTGGMLVGCVGAAVPILRVVIAGGTNQKWLAFILLAATCLAAIVIATCVPEGVIEWFGWPAGRLFESLCNFLIRG